MTTQAAPTVTDEILADYAERAGRMSSVGVLSDDLIELLAERADLKQQLAAAAITAENCELFRKDAERMRYALERLARVPGCGCSFPCRCGGAEWTRAELEGRMDLAAEALARPSASDS